MRVSIRPVSYLFRVVPLAIALVALGAYKSPDARPHTAFADPKNGFTGAPEYNPNDFDTYKEQLSFATVAGSTVLDEQFPCSDVSKCGQQKTVHLKVIPSDFSVSVHWDQALGTGNGHIVAKVINVDPVPFGPFNLTKSDVAYLWVGPMKNASKRGAALYRVKSGVPTRVFTFPDLRFCKTPNDGKPAVHSYRPGKCTDPDPKPVSAAQEASILPVTAIIDGIKRVLNRQTALNGLWISCSGGCCEAMYGS